MNSILIPMQLIWKEEIFKMSENNVLSLKIFSVNT